MLFQGDIPCSPWLKQKCLDFDYIMELYACDIMFGFDYIIELYACDMNSLLFELCEKRLYVIEPYFRGVSFN